jgi:hypothetical protein
MPKRLAGWCSSMASRYDSITDWMPVGIMNAATLAKYQGA